MTSVKELYAGPASLGAAVSSFVAVLQYFGFTSVQTVTEVPAGLYVNSVQQGTVLALIVVALVSERMWLWVLPLMPGIWLAHSRGAWVALVVGLLACCVRRVWVLGIVGIAGAFYLLSPLSSSDADRVLIWQFAVSSLKWFGWGPGMFYTVALPRGGAISFNTDYAHNDALQLLWEYGIGALLPLGIFGYAIWRTDIKEWPVVIAFTVAGCYSMPLFMPIASFLALVAVGRVLRADGLACYDSNHRGQFIVIPWQAYRRSVKVIPVASYHPAKRAEYDRK